LLKDGPELAQHLSQNERNHIYGETSEELLLLKVRPFLELEEESEEWEEMLKKVLKSDLTVSREAQKIVGTKHALSCVVALMRIGNHFFHATEMKMATIARELFDICGGVHVYIYKWCCAGLPDDFEQILLMTVVYLVEDMWRFFLRTNWQEFKKANQAFKGLKGIEDPIARAREQERLEQEMLMDDERPLWGMLREEFLEELDALYLDVVRPVRLYMGTVSTVWKETMAKYRAAGEKIVRKHFEMAWKEEAEARVGRGAGEVFVYLTQTVRGPIPTLMPLLTKSVLEDIFYVWKVAPTALREVSDSCGYNNNPRMASDRAMRGFHECCV
jgi:hypothetical protein